MNTPIQTRRIAALVAAAFLVLTAGPAAAKAPRYPELAPGEAVNGIIRPDRDRGRYRTYVLDVPPTAMGIRITLSSAPADLDLYLRHGAEMEDYGQADFYAETDMWNEELVVYRPYEAWFPSGRYYLDVAYQWSELPRSGGEVLDEVPYTLEYAVFDAAETAIALRPDAPVDTVLDRDGGYLAHFTLEVPRGTEAFRIDVLDTPGDVDLFLSREDPAPERDGYLVAAETYLGRESIRVDASRGRVSPGTYHLTVLEAMEGEYSVPLRLVATLGSQAPEAAPRPPRLPNPPPGPDTVRLATVQLVSEAGFGSGCMVSTDGLVLTNHHVVSLEDGTVVPRVYVAVAADPYEAPVEHFAAEVIRTRPDDDLALLRIIGDRWERPLPAGYRFPAWRLGDPAMLNPGDPLLLMGYPWMGSGLSRSYYTLTRGILSGGERTVRGLIYKTDAVISGGSSGGAVSDGAWSLLGLPTFVVSDEAAQLTYFVPVDRIPEDWRRLMRYE